VSIDHAGDDPQIPGWRALEIADISIAPNTYVVRVGSRHHQMLIHQLTHTESRSDS
jgi:hypothetical protein